MDELINIDETSKSFLPYPTSTLSPKIVPNDLTSFKSRGISQVERELSQKLTELREQYVEAIDQYNWNKLIYESKIQFEPVLGQVYHLYEIHGEYILSMIDPSEWHQKFVGSFRLNIDKQWESIELAEHLDKDRLFETI